MLKLQILYIKGPTEFQPMNTLDHIMKGVYDLDRE